MRKSRLALAGAVALGALALNAGGAQASIGPIGSFGNTGPSALREPRGLAVDQNNGDVYVADRAGNRVVKYDPSGGFILMFGKEVNKTKVEEDEAGKTVSEAEENVCTAESGNECQTGKEGSGSGQLNGPAGIAVDSNTGDVYVSDPPNARVEKFDAAGLYISQIVSGVGAAPSFELGRYSSDLGVDLKGNLYIANNDPKNEVLKLDPSGAYTGLSFKENSGIGMVFPESVAVDPSGLVYVTQSGPVVKFSQLGSALGYLAVPVGSGARDGVAVDLSTGNVFTTDVITTAEKEGEGEVIEYDSLGEQLATVPTASSFAIAYDAGDGRLYQIDPFSGEVSIYGTFPTPAAKAPAVSSESSSDDRLTSATISAQVNPNLLDTTYYFQYATAPTFEDAVSVPVAPADIGSGYLPLVVNADLSGLRQSTTYYYRVIAHNSFGGASGTTVTGQTEAFTTLAPAPSATTGGASEVTFDSATLAGSVVPGSAGAASDTKWCFQYGTGAGSEYNLGSMPLLPGDAGQGISAVPVSLRLTRLEPGVTYRYRLIAVNSLGLGSASTACGTEGGQEADGSEGIFTTSISLPSPLVMTGTASGVTQNAATMSGTVNPRGLRTTYEFQVGLDTSYGVAIFGEAGAGFQAAPVSLSLQYLQPGTTYHYRLVAVSQGGKVYGADETFTTPVFPMAVLSAPTATPLVATPVFAFPAAPGTAKSKVTAKKSKKKATKRTKKKAKEKAGKKGKRKKGKQAHRVAGGDRFEKRRNG
jgi:DNA-binding beta-propeller fold protein YncE